MIYNINISMLVIF